MGARTSTAARLCAVLCAFALVAAACTSADPADTPEGEGEQQVEIKGPAWFQAACDLPVRYLTRIRRGFFPDRSPDISLVPRQPNFFGGFSTTSHSGPWRYVQEIPIVFYGPGFIKAQGGIEVDREVTIADMMPTLAELLDAGWPADRPSSPLVEALLPEEERNGVPKLILFIAWDGGGWNVLRRWPDAWPNLAAMIEGGTSFERAIVGSSPSVTPAIHATMGTGTFPNEHGIIDIPVRTNGRIHGAFEGRSPRFLAVPTFADLYDQETNNEALVGSFSYKSWHWGMLGHGAYLEGGDKDIAVLAERSAGNLITSKKWFSLPEHLLSVEGLEEDIREVDLTDGRLDSTWMGHEVLDDPNLLRETPPWVLHQTRLIKALLEEEGFGRDEVGDLFFTNYKQIDEIGHSYNMVNPEMREIVEYSDAALADLIDHLDATVGRDQWVIALTADHGQTPEAVSTGAWPIRMEYLKADVAEKFGVEADEIFMEERVTGLWMDRDALRRNGIKMQQIANFLLGYTIGMNNPDGEEMPEQYRDRADETVLQAVFPSRHLDDIFSCAQERA